MSSNSGAILREPPVAGNEVDTLLGSLERQRRTFAWKCGNLDEAGLRATLGPSSMTLGGLLKHLAVRTVWSGRQEDKADDSVWAVTCLVTRKGYRKRGLTYALAAATVGYARENGARALEAYPPAPTSCPPRPPTRRTPRQAPARAR